MSRFDSSARRIRGYRPSPALIVACLALTVALGGAAIASIPDRGGTIRACYKTKGGALRVIDTSARGSAGKCAKGEKALAFNQRGLRGLQGVAGVRGLQGPQGAPGQDGAPAQPVAPGRDGAAIVLRARSTASVDSGVGGTVSVPMGNATWTQGASDIDMVPYGQITYTEPGPTSCGGTGLATLAVTFSVDGVSVGTSFVTALRDGATKTRRVGTPTYLFEPGAPTPHVLTATVSSSCESGPGTPPFTVSDLRADAIRAS